MEEDETQEMWNRNSGVRPKITCPFCKKMTTDWVVHELTCDHCGKYIGCND